VNRLTHTQLRDVLGDGAGPAVYKALHLAKLDPLLERLHHTAAID